MKRKVRQRIKSIIALGMAILMAGIPVNGMIPAVFGADASGAGSGTYFKIEFDEYIDSSTFKLLNSSDSEITPESGVADGVITWSLSAAGAYSIVAGVSDTYKTKFIVRDTTAQNNIEATGSTITITEAELGNGEQTDRIYQTVTNGEQSYTIPQELLDGGISITNVVGSGIIYKASENKVTISANTPAATELKLSFSLPMDKKATSASAVYQGVSGGKRTFTYSTTVAELLTTGISTSSLGIADAYYGIKATNTTVTCSGGWGDGTKCYEPLKTNETFTITVTPNVGYKLETFTVNGTDYFSKLTKGSGSYTINSSEITTWGAIVASSGLKPPAAPEVTFGKIEDWYKNTANITITIPAGDMPANCKLQWAFAKTGETPASWSDVGNFTNDGKSHTLSITHNTSESGNLYLRYFRTTDNVGGETTKPEPIQFDSTAPSNVTADIYVYDNAGNGTKKNDLEWVNAVNTVRIRVSATELGSGLAQLNYSIDSNPQASITEVIEAGGEKYFEIPYSIDNRCNTMVFTVVDKMGNESASKTLSLSSIKFDLVLPEATIVYKDVDGNVITDFDSGKWQTEDITMEVTPGDVEPPSGSGQEKSGFDSSKIPDTFVVKDGEDVLTAEESNGTYIYKFDTNRSHALTIEVRDNAGNIKEYTPVIRIDKVGPSEQGVVFNDSVQTAFGSNFQIKAQANSYSGIREMIVTFYDSNKKQCGTPITITAIEDNIGTCLYSQSGLENFEGYVQVTYLDNSNRLPVKGNFHEFRYNANGARIRAEAQEGWTRDSVPVIATIEDTITDIQKIEFFVDGKLFKTVDPTNPHRMTCGIALSDTSASALGTQVTIVVTSNAGVQSVANKVVCIDKQAPAIHLDGVTEGAVYNTNRTLQITTVENVWQEMKPVSVTATRTIDGNTVDIDLGSYQVGEASDVEGRTFTEDGVYRVTVSAVDAAGNRDTKTITFTIDKTAPVLSMAGTREGAYSNQPVTVNFQAVESFFETNNVRINVERRLNGSTYGRTIGFANTGRITNLSNTFSEDGDYTITMTATDGAGNVAATQTLTFTVDCTAPVVTLSGTRDYFVTNKGVTIVFSVFESYFETNEVQIQGNRRLANGRTEAIRISGWNNSGVSSALNQEFREDGYYTITMTATDRAGNNKQQVIHFTIDTEPPVIGDLSQYDGKYLSEFQLKESLEDLISELTVPTVRMTLNGEAYDGSAITTDGKYSLVIVVEDEVGLSTTKSIEFVIDRTAPKIIFAGAENKRTYTEAVSLNLALENEKDTIVSILINGVPYDLTAGAVSYDLTFDTFGEYEVIVNTIDEAGNENSQTIIFTYAEHRNAVFLWILIGAVVIAAGLVAFLVIKSKRKE